MIDWSRWRKSSHSGASGCLEARQTHDGIEVRDSKDPDGPVLSFTCDEWTAFTGGVKDGEFDLPR
jgi:hypothetical protein